MNSIELSLEENKGEKGTIGFVDMERLFREYPETKRAKAEFEGQINEKRLELKRRRSEILDMRNDVANMTVERERLLREALSEPAMAPAPVAITTATYSTPPASGLLESLPGLVPMSTGPASGVLDTTKSTEATYGIGSSTVPVIMEAAIPPAVESLSAQARAKVMEDSIAAKHKEIEAKENAFKDLQARVQAELLDLEKRRVQILLGRLYDIVQDVAKEEGVSVVVDKKAILYGQKAVDLTDKIIERVK